MRLKWTQAAAADLHRISDYLRDHHALYRQPTISKLYETIRSLKEWPHRGRPGREEGTRELLFPPLPYVAVYRVKNQDIEVLLADLVESFGADADPCGLEQEPTPEGSDIKCTCRVGITPAGDESLSPETGETEGRKRDAESPQAG